MNEPKSMKRWRIFILAAVVMVLALGVIAWPRGPKEPVYQGKTLTEWLNEANGYTGETGLAKHRVALNAIGTNALPFLLKDFTRTISPWREKFNRWAAQHPSIKFRLRDDHKLIYIAAYGFARLGSNALPAVTVVERYLDDPVRGQLADYILEFLAGECVPHLTATLLSTNSTEFTNAVARLQAFSHRPGLGRRVLAQALRHPNADVRVAAVKSWSIATGGTDDVVDDLMRLAYDPSARVIQEVSNQLARLSEHGFPPIRTAASNALLTLRTNKP
jgi:hypothetical protein